MGRPSFGEQEELFTIWNGLRDISGGQQSLAALSIINYGQVSLIDSNSYYFMTQDERASWVDSLSLHLRDHDSDQEICLRENVSYMLPTGSTTDQSREYPQSKAASLPPLSVTSRLPEFHYQPLDPSTRLHNNEPPMAHFDEITPENMPFIQQLAATNPSQFQLFILVKMQKMLLEIQTERQSLAHQQLLSNPNTEHHSSEHFQQRDPNTNDSAASSTAKPEDCKGIVYSTLSFDYATAKEEDVKLVLGE